jgi:hypothetical protein
MKPARPQAPGRRRAARWKRWLPAVAGMAIYGGVLLAGVWMQPPPALRGTEVAGVTAWAELSSHGAPGAARAPSLDGVDLAKLDDDDPRAQALLEQLRQAADRAPLVRELHGRPVALLGYVVPLDAGAGRRGFLLVPYFGACIHTPPPPANQVVHVAVQDGTSFRTMDRVLVRGNLEVRQFDHGVATSGYAIAAAAVERR